MRTKEIRALWRSTPSFRFGGFVFVLAASDPLLSGEIVTLSGASTEVPNFII
jgi:hypothetical protein